MSDEQTELMREQLKTLGRIASELKWIFQVLGSLLTAVVMLLAFLVWG